VYSITPRVQKWEFVYDAGKHLFFRIVTFSKFSQAELCYQIMAIRELLLIKPQTFDKLRRNYTVAFTMKKKGIEMVQA